MKIKSKKWIEREKLKEWRKQVLLRDKGMCQICKKKPNKPNCHHIIPEGVKELRYDVMNGMVLCFHNHKVGILSPHMHALWFSRWLRKNKPEQYKYLMRFVSPSMKRI
ncbi:hypothetical protein LCGC14_2652450 [marine sediment metagenome]|uniref:HNH nuclease domain-containing protein n=1 Tax=marine sediment metagenome TaxID=412755 RepID=A0A0F8ZUH4_9ZZZZ